jgi:hypothetical protein
MFILRVHDVESDNPRCSSVVLFQDKPPREQIKQVMESKDYLLDDGSIDGLMETGNTICCNDMLIVNLCEIQFGKFV